MRLIASNFLLLLAPNSFKLFIFLGYTINKIRCANYCQSEVTALGKMNNSFVAQHF